MSTTVWAAVAGTALAAGMLLMVSGLPAVNRPRFAERVAPHVRTSAGVEYRTRLQQSPMVLTGAVRIFAPLLNRLTGFTEHFSVDTAQLTRRLRHAGSDRTVQYYRLQQLGCSAAAVAAVLVLHLLGLASGRFHGVFAVISLAAAAVIGFMARDQLLAVQIRRRRVRMLAEFPAIAEMIALAVSAGESAPGAFGRISRASRGELAAEFGQVLQRTTAGSSFADACRDMSDSIDATPITRFLDGVVVAVERGTPLAEVMRAQAADVRELSKRELMETAGRKEVGMLAPVVFGILPLTIMFSVFPGLQLLQIGI